ncbi:hypothetical protein FHL15_009585 [Xylaria flabelliformis]|uniref:Uncharacterized protein n=1 Tax=Xylaria flabelliformis TaxID=2512241 RepID=A0A553HNK1_9PEZI|nr:hypothetical protein FHL15_009585 [Xylaria flabelliformis]
MAGSSTSTVPENDYQYSMERRWPRKRGGYNIEKQCSACKWFFDSFDPECEVCHSCSEGAPQPPQVEASIPILTAQQSEVPRALPYPLQSFGVPGVANTELGDTQYQAYGQGYEAGFDPTYSQGTLSNLPGGYNIPGQIWAQGYDMSFTSSDPMGGFTQNQAFAQGHVALPDILYPSETMSNPLAEYTPNQQQGQECSMPIDPSSSFGTQSYSTGGYIQNPNYYQGDGSSSTLSQHPDVPVPIAKPLRPILPRERTPQRPAEPESKDNEDNSQSYESSAYRPWLKRKPAHKNVVKKRGSKGKGSGNQKKLYDEFNSLAFDQDILNLPRSSYIQHPINT